MGRLLLIEADAESRARHQQALEAAGHELVAAPGVNGALGALGPRPDGAPPVDLLIVEVGLMDAHGVDVLTRLRALPGASALPVLGLAAAGEALRGELSEDPLDDLLLTPAQPERLVQVSERLLVEGPEEHARLQRLIGVQAALRARLAALARANEAIASSASPEAVLDASLRSYVDTGAFGLASALLFSDGQLRMAACVCSPAPRADALILGAQGLLDRAAASPRPLLLPDEGEAALAEALGLATVWVGAIRDRGEVLGVAVLGSEGRGLAGAGGFIAAVLAQLGLATRVSRGVAALAASELRFRHIAEELPRGLVASERGRVVYLNATAGALLGVEPADVQGAPLASLLPEVEVGGRVERRVGQRVLRVEARRYEGSEQDPHLLLLLDDVTRRRRRERTLAVQALTDPLTGLGNRRFLEQEGQALLETLHEEGRRCALLFLDLDHFKEVNDVQGHAAGDALLRVVAEALVSKLRTGDLVARLGGDEFAVLMPGARAEVAAERARALREAVLEATRGQRLGGASVDVSVGVAESRGRDIGALLQAADMAMYRAKRGGRGRVVLE
ncbi:MAG: diguanylate cyclase [Alphaproteobacteria bacterium]|nr:diguanylate cyclase [Alphaproteobacteria bacterium]